MLQPKAVKAINVNTGEETIAKRMENFTDDLLNCGYTKGVNDERNRIIKILENNWLRGTVARRIIDDIISEINAE